MAKTPNQHATRMATDGSARQDVRPSSPSTVARGARAIVHRLSGIAKAQPIDPSRRPLLAVDDLRIDVDGVPACEGLTFSSRGERVLVLGAPRALFAATLGLVHVVRGTLSVRGVSSAEAVSRGVVAGVATNTPTPARFSVHEYVEWSARLAGISSVSARASADAAIAKLELGPMSKTPTSKLVPHARRATVVAAALATGAEVIALEDPLRGLPEDIGRSYADVLCTALSDRAWIVFAPQMPLVMPLTLAADEAIVATATHIDAQGAPTALAASARRFVVQLSEFPERLSGELEARGVRIDARGAQAHLELELAPDMTTGELLVICDRADVAVISLSPVSRALS